MDPTLEEQLQDAKSVRDVIKTTLKQLYAQQFSQGGEGDQNFTIARISELEKSYDMWDQKVKSLEQKFLGKGKSIYVSFG